MTIQEIYVSWKQYCEMTTHEKLPGDEKICNYYTVNSWSDILYVYNPNYKPNNNLILNK